MISTEWLTAGRRLKVLVGHYGSGKTELAVHTIAGQLNMSTQAIHQSLLKGDSADFAQTDLA